MWSTGEGNGKPLQHSCLENPMNSMRGKPYIYSSMDTGFFHILAILNNMTMNRKMQISFQDSASFYFFKHKHTFVESLDHMVVLFFNLGLNFHTVFHSG